MEKINKDVCTNNCYSPEADAERKLLEERANEIGKLNNKINELERDIQAFLRVIHNCQNELVRLKEDNEWYMKRLDDYRNALFDIGEIIEYHQTLKDVKEKILNVLNRF